MNISLQVTDISHVIQLSVAPVFLLAGISGILSVLSIRLGRIVDRARYLDERLPDADKRQQSAINTEHKILSQRARLANRAISLCTITALLICSVIVVLFVDAFLDINIAVVIAPLFITSMFSLIAALLIFLKEIFIGTTSLRIGQN